MEKLLTVNDIAEYLQVSPRTIREWVCIGFIPHFKIMRNIRFQKEKIEQWISRKHKKGRATYKLQVDNFGNL